MRNPLLNLTLFCVAFTLGVQFDQGQGFEKREEGEIGQIKITEESGQVFKMSSGNTERNRAHFEYVPLSALPLLSYLFYLMTTYSSPQNDHYVTVSID